MNLPLFSTLEPLQKRTMTQGTDKPGVLWMFRRQGRQPPPREVRFDPDDPIYVLHKHTRNPFLVRAIAPPAKKLERSGEDLKKLFRFFQDRKEYQVAPVNDDQPHARRNLKHPPPPPAHQPQFTRADTLKGDMVRLPWMIDLFFKAVMDRLREHPGEFKTVVEELIDQFREDDIQIKIYDAYRTFRDWNDLMDTLSEITRYPSPETFDLFCSALFAYYDLAFPPTTA